MPVCRRGGRPRGGASTACGGLLRRPWGQGSPLPTRGRPRGAPLPAFLVEALDDAPQVAVAALQRSAVDVLRRIAGPMVVGEPFIGGQGHDGGVRQATGAG